MKMELFDVSRIVKTSKYPPEDSFRSRYLLNSDGRPRMALCEVSTKCAARLSKL
jgi:hypothetical protein